MELIINIIVGGIIGWVASMIMKTNAQMGKIANVVVGIIGMYLGYWLADVLGLAASGGIAKWLVAVGGAVVLIGLLRVLGIYK